MPDTSLLVTAGDGPGECRQAVGHILDRMQDEADLAGLDLSVHRSEGEHGPRSAVVLVHGEAAETFARRWLGTIQWRTQSRIRKHHKRANWFVGVFRLERFQEKCMHFSARKERRINKRGAFNDFVFIECALARRQETDVKVLETDVAFSALRAGGPGGQHQNTTDSAVRAVHRPTGLTVVVRDGRSQHRNRALALERLRNLAETKAVAEREQEKSSRNQLHHALDRGNPVRRFRGETFEEVD